LRHAKSDWGNPLLSDHDRPLNDRGQHAADKMGKTFKNNGLKPEYVVCSTATRARETLDRVMAFLPDGVEVEYRKDSYLASPRTLLKTINGIDDRFASVMLVGHNPGTEELAESLISEGNPEAWATMMTKYPTAALSIIYGEVDRWRDLSFNANKLAAFIRPKFIDEDLLNAELRSN